MKKIINIIILILWMCLIFFFSSQNADESTKTSGIFDNIINIVFKDDSVKPTVKYVVRKIAHFTEYCILAILVLNVIKDYTSITYKTLIIAFILCALYAASDEWHQTFVDGRAGQLFDVFIDSCGVLTGLILYKYVIKRK